MKVHQGSSSRPEADEAIAEATRDWPAEAEIVFVFCSASFDAGAVSRALAQRLPNTPIVGCTTAGEHLDGTHSNGSLVLTGIYDSSITWSTKLVQGLSKFGADRAADTVDQLFAALGQERDEIDPDEHFAMLLIDGLSMAEERFTAVLTDALEGIPMAGGSAGDDLAFAQTLVITEQGAFSDAAIVVLGNKGDAQVELVKHQHYVTTPRALCITRADPEARVVYEIDGRPAIEAYADALGLPPSQVTGEVSFLNPLTFSCNWEIYVRSVQTINDDGSMTFYCGIEEGMVVQVGGHEPMRDRLREDMGRFAKRFGKPSLLVGFNCILRALEAGQSDEHEELGTIFKEGSEAMIGFDTYGEQFNGLHINQTLVAVAFLEPAEAGL